MALLLPIFYEGSVTQWLSLTVMLFVILQWLSMALGPKIPKYKWVNCPWLPRFLNRKHAHEYVESGYSKVRVGYL